MTNAQKATYRALKDLLAPYQVGISPPTPLYEWQYSSVLVEIQHRGEDTSLTFLIEAGGCLARVYA